jgi:tight adherence protein C
MFDLATLPFYVRGAVLLLVFVAVTAIVLTLITLTNNRMAVRRRMDERLAPAAAGSGPTLRTNEGGKAWVRFVNAIEERGLSLSDTRDDKLKALLRTAGYTHPIAPKVYTFVRLVLTLGMPAAYVFSTYWSGKPPTLIKLWVVGSIFAGLGLYLPNLFVRAKADRRRRDILNGFPDGLDLMLVCVEAGLGLEAAFDRVGQEMMKPHPLLAGLLAGVVLELRAGRSREDALRLMADRAQIDEIRAFTTLLIQSTKLGSSIGQTLRIYAAEMREARRLRAEEKAHRLPVLLSIPLVACMLPTMIGVLMLPAIIRVIRQLFPAMGAG